jgi:hypothetical protein
MELATPVTLTVDNAELTLTQLEPVLIDDSARKLVLARLHPVLRPIMLWRGANYDEIGDWTQAQAEAKILELLGDNQQEALHALSGFTVA